MLNNDHILGDVSLSTFLQEHWQQKPLLVKNAFPDYSCPISVDEMAGLACELGVESRIILERDGEHPWQCQHGPFDETIFSQLPETHWTLLLQSCNLYVPAFAQLLEQFRFIPNWRVDDIMVSYAAPSGSVGPHTDNYDVFLLQAQGKRRWNISTQLYTDADFIPNLGLKILKSFNTEKSWQLNPGDMLYLPPGVAHHGIADNSVIGDDCITISIGFRAPNLNELATAVLDEVLSQHAIRSTSLQSSDFYQDPNLDLQKNPGEISAQSVQKITDMVQQELNSELLGSDWFGKYITSTNGMSEAFPLNETQPDITRDQCIQPLIDGQQLIRNESAKLAFFIPDKNTKNDKTIHFFYNGNVTYYSWDLLPVISLICNERYPSSALLADMLDDRQAQSFLVNLITQGHLYYDQGDDEY